MEKAVKRLKRWQKSDPSGPLKVQFNPTDRCNLGCIFCWQRDSHRVSYKNEISTKRYLELVKESNKLGVKEIQLTGGGEPFCRPKTTLKLMEEIKKYDIRGSLITNGTLFKEKDIEKIINFRWDEIILSLDSSKAEIHDYLRNQKGSFKKTIDSIKKVNKYKKDKPKLCIHFVLCNKNYKELPELIKLANKLRIKNVFIEPIVTVTDIANISEKLKLNKNQLKELQRISKKAYELCMKYHIENNLEKFIELNLTEKTNMMDEVIKKPRKSNKKFDPLCFEPFYNMIIRPNGRVGPCCMFDHSGEYCHHKSLKEIWFGKHFNKVREKLLKWELMGYCSKCNPSQVVDNIKMKEMIQQGSSFINKIKNMLR